MIRGLLLAVFALSMPAAAQAQMDWVGIQAESMRFGNLIRHNLEVNNGPAANRPQPARPTARQRPAAATATAATGTTTGNFTFTSTPGTRRLSLDGYIERVSRHDPASGQAIAAEYRRFDPFAIHDQVTALYGLRGNDAADVLTAYSVLGYVIATGSQDPSAAQIAGARAQIARQMAADAQLADPATRTAFAEEVKLLFVTLHSGWKTARQDGSLERYRAGVAQLFARQGTDFSRLRLTASGFSPA